MNCACCLHVKDLAPKILTLPNVLNTKMKLHKGVVKVEREREEWLSQ